MVGVRLGGRLQKFHVYGRRREVLVAIELDRPIAFGYDVTVPRGLHGISPLS
jgi:hypothetical protein